MTELTQLVSTTPGTKAGFQTQGPVHPQELKRMDKLDYSCHDQITGFKSCFAIFQQVRPWAS